MALSHKGVRVDLGAASRGDAEDLLHLMRARGFDDPRLAFVRRRGTRLYLDARSAAELRLLIGGLAWWLNNRPAGGVVAIRTTWKPVKLKSGADEAELERVFRSLITPSMTGASTVYLPISSGSTDGPALAWPDGSHARELDAHGTSEMPVTIYLSDEGIHERVEAAVETLLGAAGLQVSSRDDPVLGSWFRRMLATMKEAVRSPAAREATLTATHLIDRRLVLAQDAAVTATLLQNLGPTLTSLQPTKDAVIRAGALLIVKVDWAVHVFQLTAAQQAILDHQPRLARSPHEIITALNLTPEDHEDGGYPELS
jgi:hypothetical protein